MDENSLTSLTNSAGETPAANSLWTQPPSEWLSGLSGPLHARFVSDLHLLSPRSRGGPIASYLPDPKADLLVLGGDIFDFRWSSLPSIDDSVEAAFSQLRDLLQHISLDHNRKLKIAYLLGNHDCLSAFVDRLERLSEEFPQFCLVRHQLAIADTLFVHGDILDAGQKNVQTRDQLAMQLHDYRSKFEHAETQSTGAHRVYDAAVAIRLHQAIPRLRHPTDNTTNRLARMLQLIDPEQFKKTRTICFGHTHKPINGYQVDGVTFENGGACLKHLKHHPVDLKINANCE